MIPGLQDGPLVTAEELRSQLPADPLAAAEMVDEVKRRYIFRQLSIEGQAATENRTAHPKLFPGMGPLRASEQRKRDRLRREGVALQRLENDLRLKARLEARAVIGRVRAAINGHGD